RLLAAAEAVRAAGVIGAAGIGPVAWRPPEFRGMDRELATHSSEHRDLSSFAGSNVVVIGAGQSALESAALMHEAGARVEVIARAPNLTWLRGGTIQRRLGRAKPLLSAQTDVGPAGLRRLVAVPALFGRLPRAAQSPL